MTIARMIQEVGRCGLGLAPVSSMIELLERDLFVKVIPACDKGEVSSSVGKALLQLYSDIQVGSDAQSAARLAFDEICKDPKARFYSPVESVVAGLEEAALIGRMSYQEARKLVSLPWAALEIMLPADLAVSASNFKVEIEAILHEVEEGFVGTHTDYPGLVQVAAKLASDLRSYTTLMGAHDLSKET